LASLGPRLAGRGDGSATATSSNTDIEPGAHFDDQPLEIQRLEHLWRLRAFFVLRREMTMFQRFALGSISRRTGRVQSSPTIARKDSVD
jgi:hypothetical protein